MVLQAQTSILPQGLDSNSRIVVFVSAGLGIPLGSIVCLEFMYNKAIVERYEKNSGIKYEIDLGIAISLN